MIRYALYGLNSNNSQDIIGGPWVEHPSKDLIAVFTSFEKASQYVSRSRLKNPKHFTWGNSKVFRNGSLLAVYEDCEIEQYFEPEVDPVL